MAVQVPALAAEIPVTIYRNPNCGCCDLYAQYLKGQGFAVELVNTTNAAAIRQKYAVPERLEGCHTAVVGRYVFEGLIPAQYIKRVVDQNRPIKGLSVPGMPVGAPGMPAAKKGPINVHYLDASPAPTVYATF